MRRILWLLLLGLCSLWSSVGQGRAEESVASPPPAALEKALTDLSSDDPAVQDAAVLILIEQDDAGLLPRLEELRGNADRGLRMALKPVIDLLRNKSKLQSPDPNVRRSAAADLAAIGKPIVVTWLEDALKTEPDRWVRYTIDESVNLIKLAENDPQVKIAAAAKLGELRSQNAIPHLTELVGGAASEAGGGTGQAEQAQHAMVARAAKEAIEQIESWGSWTSAIETLFRGLSLSSVLLLMALGLAIIFGLMGVINMAHGEFMMLGAYATFLTQECFKAYLPVGLFDYYFLLAMPGSFLVAGLFGLFLEATLIRFLYGRPLETLLATWGVSLVLIQGARVVFGDLTSVVAPSWLSGGMQVMVGVQLPYNRLFIIALASLCVAGIYLLLFRSGVGLRVRAVMQNRDMSACLAIPT
ncbi:MAG: hypothetical protein EPO64_09315, partial [Nitrospirae bacterium]